MINKLNIKIGRNYIFECSDYIDESVSLLGECMEDFKILLK